MPSNTVAHRSSAIASWLSTSEMACAPYRHSETRSSRYIRAKLDQATTPQARYNGQSSVTTSNPNGAGSGIGSPNFPSAAI
jgi:hypothetical protein